MKWHSLHLSPNTRAEGSRAQRRGGARPPVRDPSPGRWPRRSRCRQQSRVAPSLHDWDSCSRWARTAICLCGFTDTEVRATQALQGPFGRLTPGTLQAPQPWNYSKSPVHARGNRGACPRYYKASSCHSYGQFSPRPVPPRGALRGRALLPGSAQAGLTDRCGPHLPWVGRVRPGDRPRKCG